MLLVAAALWGFAEATLFFVVPDIIVTYIAMRRGMRAAVVGAAVAVVGAVAGGVVMYLWGAHLPTQAITVVEAVPAIGPGMLSQASEHLRVHGSYGLFFGSANGIPYKVYAVLAPQESVDLLDFAAVSFPARLYRLLFAAVAAGFVFHWLRKRPERMRLGLFAGFWIASYTVYFYHFW